MPLDPREVVAAVVGPPPEILKDMLDHDQLLVELRERSGAPVIVTIARTDQPDSPLGDARGLLRFTDEPHTIAVGDSTFTLDPSTFDAATWFTDDEAQRRFVHILAGPLVLSVDFDTPTLERGDHDGA